MALRRDLIWVDAQGENVLHIMTGASSMAAIMSNLISFSNADVLDWWEATNNARTPTPTVATYPTVRVQAILEFRSSATGSAGRLFIPSPKSSIFLSDGVTVDPSAIGALISAVEGVLLAGDSTTVDQFIGGQIYATRTNAIASLQTFTP